MGGAPARVREIPERIDPIEATTHDVRAYVKDHSEFEDIGTRMLQQWEQGVALSLRAA